MSVTTGVEGRIYDPVAEPYTYSHADLAGPISWRAIIAGAVGSIVATIILLLLGAGIGLSAISPWSGVGASAAAVGVSTIIGLIAVQWLSSAFGGFLAGRLRARWTNVNADEVTFRDTAHGFLAWALASLVGVMFFASITSAGIGGLARGVGGAASAAIEGAADEGSSWANDDGYFVDTLFRPNATAATQAGGDPRAETARILWRSTKDGQVSLTAEDRAYVIQVVAANTGATQEDATARVDSAVSQINAASAKARDALDEARKKAAQASLATALAMLIGAFIAAAAGGLGGKFRDED